MFAIMQNLESRRLFTAGVPDPFFNAAANPKFLAQKIDPTGEIAAVLAQ
jgi:hypothetical protein